MRVSNLPESDANDMRNCHISAIVSSEHLEVDTASGRLKRVISKPKSLHPTMMVICDDLYAAYHKGIRVLDSTVIPRSGDPRHFKCRCKLLTALGDYPGMGMMAGMTHSGAFGCHWCKMRFPYLKSVGRNVCLGHMAMLARDHPFHQQAQFDDLHQPLGHNYRTHKDILDDAAKDSPTTTGVLYLSPLAYLPGFDLVWDFGVDMMHILEGWLKRNLLSVMRGKRKRPTKPSLERKRDPLSDVEKQEIMDEYKDELRRYDLWSSEWNGKEGMKEMDRRYVHVVTLCYYNICTRQNI